MTGKDRYGVNETVIAAVAMENLLPFPVRYPAFTSLEGGGVMGEERVMGGFLRIFDRNSSTRVMPPFGRECLYNWPLYPKREGILTIEVELEGPSFNRSFHKDIEIEDSGPG